MTGDEPDVSLHIGKAGITEAVVAELKEQLRKHGRVKVRMHRTAAEAADRRAAFEGLAEAARARLERVVGFVAVFARP